MMDLLYHKQSYKPHPLYRPGPSESLATAFTPSLFRYQIADISLLVLYLTDILSAATIIAAYASAYASFSSFCSSFFFEHLRISPRSPD
jgi:hypothetical protein